MERRHPSTGQNTIGKDDCQIRQGTLTGSVDLKRGEKSSSARSTRQPAGPPSTLNRKTTSTTQEQIVTSHPGTISRRHMVSAATTVMAAGPSATVGDLVSILENPPHSLPLGIAEGIVIGARLAASSVASWRLESMTNQHGWFPSSQSAREALDWWAREPDWSRAQDKPHRPLSLMQKDMSSASGSEASSNDDVNSSEDEDAVTLSANRPQLLDLEADQEALTSQPSLVIHDDASEQNDESDEGTPSAEESHNGDDHESPVRKKKKRERREERRLKRVEDRQELTRMRELVEAMERRLPE